LKNLLLVVVFVSLSGWSSALDVQCGTYGPKEYINIGTTLETTGLFASPLAAYSSAPYLLGCTPSQATLQSKNTSEYIIYSYVANGFFVSTSHWYKSGNPVATVTNEYENSTNHPFIVNSYFGLRSTFVNVSFQYDAKLLDSVAIYSPNIDVEEYNELMNGPIGIKKNTLDTEISSPEPETAYNSFSVYDYGDNKLENQATNISTTNNIQGKSSVFNIFTTDSTGVWIVRIIQTITGHNGSNTNKRYVYYDSTLNFVTKICSVSCVMYSYDSNGRLTSVSENGQTLESYKYTSVNGVSRIVSANLGTYGTWTFTY